MPRRSNGYKSFRRDHPVLAGGMRLWKTAQVARGAYQMARKIAKVINSEKKYFDAGTSTSPDTTASITCLTGMAQGSSEITRHGNSIKLEQLYLKGTLTTDYSNAPYEIIRIAIVRDTDNNQGTAPTYTEIFENAQINAMINKDHSKRFKLLWDRKYIARSDVGVYNIKFFKQFRMYKDKYGNPTQGAHATFTAGTAADTGKGHIYLIIFGNTATATTASVLTWQSRLRFYDN